MCILQVYCRSWIVRANFFLFVTLGVHVHCHASCGEYLDHASQIRESSKSAHVPLGVATLKIFNWNQKSLAVNNNANPGSDQPCSCRGDTCQSAPGPVPIDLRDNVDLRQIIGGRNPLTEFDDGTNGSRWMDFNAQLPDSPYIEQLYPPPNIAPVR